MIYDESTFGFQKPKRVYLSDEVHHDQMQHDVRQDEVGKASLGRNSSELQFVLWVDLQTEAHWGDQKRIRG